MRPHNSYGLSKRDQDDIAMHLGRRYAIPSVAFRYSIVQGPRQSFRNAYSGALRAFTVQLGSKVAPLIYEDGRQIRDYVSIHDVVRANMLPLDDESMAYHSYNVGGNRTVRVTELADLVARVIGVDIDPVMPGLYRVGDTRHIRSDVSGLQCHGWRVQEALEDTVLEYTSWALASPGFFNAANDALQRMESMGVLRRSIVHSGV
jgi:dTDP-L-rhamnose 4-epimerase